MKTLTFVPLCLIMLLVMAGCDDQAANLRARTLAQAMAETLGRTPSNNLVEFLSCGAFRCTYDVYFTSPDDFNGMNARVPGLIKENNLKLRYATPQNFPGMLMNINGDLDRTSLKGRLVGTVISGTARADGTDFEPAYSYWDFLNENGLYVAEVSLYLVKDGRVKYAFNGKPITGNIGYVRVYVNPSKL